MTTTAVVGHEPMYRIVEGPYAGLEVPRADTHACTGSCHGSGRAVIAGGGGVRSRTCRTCGGSGRLLGDEPNRYWPVAVERVEDAPTGATP